MKIINVITPRILLIFPEILNSVKFTTIDIGMCVRV